MAMIDGVLPNWANGYVGRMTRRCCLQPALLHASELPNDRLMSPPVPGDPTMATMVVAEVVRLFSTTIADPLSIVDPQCSPLRQPELQQLS
jgi:hypothetical protein